MKNKILISKLKDYAELAMAAYGYFNLIGKNFDNKRNKTQEKRSITLYDILDSTYNGYVTPDHTMLLNPEKLKGEFTPTQAKQFLDKYDLLIHQPNTDSGFSATVFQNKQTNEYVLSFSGTKPDDIGDIKSDKDLALGNIPKEQYFDMLLFYYQCIGKIPFYATSETKPKGQDTSFICDKLDIKCSHSVEYKLWEKLYQRSTESKYKPYIAESLLKDSSLPTTSNFTPPIDSTTKLTITGHSLGGCLAQLFALSFATESHQDSIIKEVYTFNAPGAKNLKLYDIILSIPNNINESIQNYLLATYTKKLKDKAQELKINTHDLDTQINLTLKEIIYNTNNANTHFGISLSSRSGNPSVGLEYANITYEAIHYELSNAYQTLTHNYNNRNKESYKLSISDKTFHIESQNKTDKKHHARESYTQNATQHLGKDIEGNYFILNLNFGGLDSHSITSMAKILYFYAYLYEVNESLIDTTSKEVKTEYELHKDEFLKEHNEIDTKEYGECKKALEYCNILALAIYNILRAAKIHEYKQTIKQQNTYVSEAEMSEGIKAIENNINSLHATLDKTLFEATLHTKQEKLQVDNTNLIEGILYLQDKGIFLQLLTEEKMQEAATNTALRESNLAILLAIHERLFFISVIKQDGQTRALI